MSDWNTSSAMSYNILFIRDLKFNEITYNMRWGHSYHLEEISYTRYKGIIVCFIYKYYTHICIDATNQSIKFLQHITILVICPSD